MCVMLTTVCHMSVIWLSHDCHMSTGWTPPQRCSQPTV